MFTWPPAMVKLLKEEGKGRGPWVPWAPSGSTTGELQPHILQVHEEVSLAIDHSDPHLFALADVETLLLRPLGDTQHLLAGTHSDSPA